MYKLIAKHKNGEIRMSSLDDKILQEIAVRLSFDDFTIVFRGRAASPQVIK